MSQYYLNQMSGYNEIVLPELIHSTYSTINILTNTKYEIVIHQNQIYTNISFHWFISYIKMNCLCILKYKL